MTPDATPTPPYEDVIWKIAENNTKVILQLTPDGKVSISPEASIDDVIEVLQRWSDQCKANKKEPEGK